jgi:hypothetical protein
MRRPDAAVDSWEKKHGKAQELDVTNHEGLLGTNRMLTLASAPVVPFNGGER